MKNDLLNLRDIFAYFLVAAAGVLIQLIIGTLAQDWFGITYVQSLTAGYLVAFVAGFFLTKIFAFNTKSKREMIKFALVAALSFCITVYGSDALFQLSLKLVGQYKFQIPFSVKLVDINQLFSLLTCTGISFISNYTLHKKFTFQDTGFYDRLKSLLSK
ncbi:GtrA family protein [Dyadobacter sp. CY356]|uniref:GtrA family protein n=1 Tax=Dyadobacter sp. CY356 TaxID=2906442 RepID=UPI001F37E97A|nr:GtrA family protein [Dyadobacter sp. CY356]MCF0058902.1 GtrA family protein [Dyadobacter sp. CY356]